MSGDGALPRLKSLLESLGAAAATLALIGYCSLRAHLNHLGIPSSVEVPTVLYLQEAYLFVSAWIATVLLLSVPAVLVYGIGRLSASWFLRFPLDLTTRLLRVSAAIFVCAAPILLLLAARTLIPSEQLAKLLWRPSPTETAGPEIFACAVATTLLALSIAAADPLYAKAGETLGWYAAQLLRLLQYFVAAALLWVSIFIFNTTPPTIPDYPIVRLVDADDKLIACGLLVFSSASELVLWREYRARSGENLSIWPRTSFRALRFDGRNTLGDFANAASAAGCGDATLQGNRSVNSAEGIARRSG
ncbi:hypothetical protein NKI82_05590 [Mesorhizobium sp. M0482]|uniref:hypothetical protein n=1 Tax=Mesorhizobium sp. M0482 TaxID=2956948 RepID=UPI003338BBF3